ncbi:unnamed protein product [Rotaria sordida]|uniref:Uncharacterized protein n=1 Tax=Rotaria sordida TaxID=392033 RepID=A0A815D6U0_9BILA|nr:unnamed protein product [Rotaria sordida]
MITSPNAWLRQQSSPRVARRSIIIGIGFFTIYSMHAPIGFQTNPVTCSPPFGSKVVIKNESGLSENLTRQNVQAFHRLMMPFMRANSNQSHAYGVGSDVGISTPNVARISHQYDPAGKHV